MRRARDLEAQESPVSPTRIRSGGNEGLWDPWASAAAQRFGNVSSVSATLGCAECLRPYLVRDRQVQVMRQGRSTKSGFLRPRHHCLR